MCVYIPAVDVGKSGIAKRWKKREISNFEYLMELNRIGKNGNGQFINFVCRIKVWKRNKERRKKKE